ncbi:MAG: hypothetical protein LBV75_09145, partial [Paludibacter sp.]|nr:hypothetical protein [Paludibacter sp.]
MKKLTLLTVVLLTTMLMGVNAQEKFWNFSVAPWGALSITADTVIDGMTIRASSAKTIALDASSKTIDGITFSRRLKFGGTGTLTERNISFAVQGPCSIVIYGCSS